MKPVFNPETAQTLRELGDFLHSLRVKQLGSSFADLAIAFESAETPEERRRIAEQGLVYFSQENGLNYLVITRNGTADTEANQDLDTLRLIVRKLLERHL